MCPGVIEQIHASGQWDLNFISLLIECSDSSLKTKLYNINHYSPFITAAHHHFELLAQRRR